MVLPLTDLKDDLHVNLLLTCGVCWRSWPSWARALHSRTIWGRLPLLNRPTAALRHGGSNMDVLVRLVRRWHMATARYRHRDDGRPNSSHDMSDGGDARHGPWETATVTTPTTTTW